MSKKHSALGIGFFVLMSLYLLLSASPAAARNPDLSYWTLNLSSSAAPDENTREDFAPEVAVVGNTVHVLWIRNNPNDYTLFYRRSTDGGQTWEPKQTLLTATNWSSFRVDKTLKRMVAEGDYVHIAYIYNRNLY
jgi:hypothetical protein